MKVLKVVLAVLSLAFFGAALGMFGLYFIDTKTVVGSFTNISHFTNGFKLAFQAKDLGLEANDGLGTLFAFIFVVLGILAACYGLFVALTAKKSKKGNNIQINITPESTYFFYFVFNLLSVELFQLYYYS